MKLFWYLIVTLMVMSVPPSEQPEAHTVPEPPVIEAKKEVKKEVKKVEKPKDKYKSYGKFRITAYCPCYECSEEWGDQTATGVRAKEGRTIAVDPKVIPYGTKVLINDHVYIAEDCGGAIDGNEIDIYFKDHESTEEFGVQHLEVKVKVGEK